MADTALVLGGGGLTAYAWQVGMLAGLAEAGVDLGGAETNSEMAIEIIGEPRSEKIRICNAPVVEGAVMAATEASGGAALVAVVATAEELSPL